MSFLLDLSEDRLDAIVPLIVKYEQKVAAAEPIFKLEGKRLEEIMRTLPHYQVSYDQAFQEVKGLEEWVISLRDKRVGKAWKKYTENYSHKLSTRDVQAYIGAEKDVFELNQLLAEIVLIKHNLESIVEAIKQMGWMVGHVTKLRIAEMQDAIL